MRDESRRLIDEMLRFDLSSIPNHQAVIGSRGSGKTLTIKYLQRLVPRHTSLSIVYANCRQHNTSFKILAYLLDVLPRGASMAELFGRFCRAQDRKTVLVLDEVDLMSLKDRRREIVAIIFLAHAGALYVWREESSIRVKQRETDAKRQGVSRSAQTAEGIA